MFDDAPAALAHVRAAALRAQEAAFQVGAQRAIPFGFGEVEERLQSAAGRCSPDVEPREFLERARKHAVDIRRHTDVTLNRHGLAANGGNLGERCLRARGVGL